MAIKTEFEMKNGDVAGVKSVYDVPIFKTKEEAIQDYEEILNIILTYQHKTPPSIWRRKIRKSPLFEEKGIEYGPTKRREREQPKEGTISYRLF